MMNLQGHPVSSDGVKPQTNLHLSIKCPKCGTTFPAHLDGADDTLRGTCTSCGRAAVVRTPHLAEKMAQRTAAAVEEALAHESTAKEGAADPHLTTTVDGERDAANAQSARKVALGINVGAGLTAAWGFIYPAPYHLVVTLLALWPFVALLAVARSGGVIRLNDRKGSKAPHVAYGLLAPILVLAFLMAHLHIADYGAFWAPFVATSLIIIVLFQRLGVAAQEEFKTRLLLVPFLAAYGYGIVVVADTQMDQSNATVHRAAVLSKRISSSSHGGNSYYLTLSAWGTHNSGDEVSISRLLYSDLRPNDTVNIFERPGYFNIPWYTVREAPRKTP